METQSAYDNNNKHQLGQGEDDQRQEKPSVLRKVKAKAKRIKDTIKKHSPGHNRDHGHDQYREGQIPDDRDLDEEDGGDEEEIVQNPEVHGAPLNESASAKNVISEQPEDLSRPGITNFETSKAMPTDTLASRERTENYETKHNDPSNSVVSGLEAPQVREQPRVDFGETTDTVMEPLAPLNDSAAVKNIISGQPEDESHLGVTNSDTSEAFTTDPLVSREISENYNTGNYGTKHNDPPNSAVNGLEAVKAPLLKEQPRVDFGKTDTVEEPLAPINSSVAAKNDVSGQSEDLSRPGIINFETSKDMSTNPLALRERTENYETKHNDPPSSVVSGLEATLVREQPRVDSGKTTDTVKEPLAPINESLAVKNVASGQPEDLSRHGFTKLETSKALPTDPLASRERPENYYNENYETKRNDIPNSAVTGLEAPLVGNQPRVDLGKTTDIVDEPLASINESVVIKNIVSGQPEDLSRPGFENPKALPTMNPLASEDRSENYYTGNHETKRNDPPNSVVTGLEAPLVENQSRADLGKTTDTVDEPLAPINESIAAKNVISRQPEDLSRPGFETSKALPTDPLTSRERSENYYTGNYETKPNDPPNSAVTGLEVPLVGNQPRVDLGKTTDTVDEPLAPTSDFPAAKNIVSGQPEDLIHLGIANFETSKTLPERSGNYEAEHDDQLNSAVSGLETPQVREQPKVDLGKTIDTVEEPLAPQNTPLPSTYQVKDEGREEYPGQQEVDLQRPKGLDEDDAVPRDTFDAYTTTNDQTKVTDPTGEGGEATGIAPILHSMDKMKIDDEHDKGGEQNLPSETQPRPSDIPFPTGTHDQFSPEPTRQEQTHNVDKPSNQSSYTEKISPATSAVADKAVSAENTVASKLGYGDNDQAQSQSPITTNESREGQDTTKQEQAMDYEKTDKPSPVCEKAAGVGSAVMSETEHVQDQDKGVSVKSYIAEKFKPGDEDRALSEMISEALLKRKEDSPEAEKETRETDTVTESKEVASRLDTGGETKEKTGSGSMNSPTQGVVGKLKGAVGSWFGKGEKTQKTPQAHSSSYSTTPSADGRILQESDN